MPETLEPLGGCARIDGRMFPVAMTKVVLDRAQVFAIVRQRILGGEEAERRVRVVQGQVLAVLVGVFGPNRRKYALDCLRAPNVCR